jgi:hypothetical protein
LNYTLFEIVAIGLGFVGIAIVSAAAFAIVPELFVATIFVRVVQLIAFRFSLQENDNGAQEYFVTLTSFDFLLQATGFFNQGNSFIHS